MWILRKIQLIGVIENSNNLLGAKNNDSLSEKM